MALGNIGSALAGISATIIAILTLIRGPAALRDWQKRQRDQAAAREQAETTRLDRRCNLDGWNVMGVNTYGATLVTDPAELAQAVTELTSGQPTAYAVLRVTGSTDSGNANLALSLRQLIQAEGYISRPPPPENAKPSKPASTPWASPAPHTGAPGSDQNAGTAAARSRAPHFPTVCCFTEVVD
jgi:hypothetical protein